MKSELKLKLENLPKQPGCYLMKNKDDVVIYVGKAKSLSNRVRSYFTGSHDGKTAKLVSEIVDFDYIVTTSEIEALVLEITLIKEHDPKYNILLKDDKTYPYIEITLDQHPMLNITRKIDKKNKHKRYFGPYPNVKAARETKLLLDKLYPLRKCKTIPKKECLYYHMHQCLAPCIKEVNNEDYKKITDEISKFLNGNIEHVKENLVTKMNYFAERLEFETAKEYRDLLRDIEDTIEKQKIIVQDMVDSDVIGYHLDKGYLSINIFYYRGGKLVAKDNKLYPIIDDVESELSSFIVQYYQNKPLPKVLYLPNDEDVIEGLKNLLEVNIMVPKRGEKRKIVEMAIENAKIYLEENFYLAQRNHEKTQLAIEQLGQLLNIKTPYIIEAFDNSHTNGVDPVSAMVTFINGRESKKGYRKYKLSKENGGDDLKNMREVIYRRYFRVLRDNLPKPDLIVIDGGLNQVNVCKEVLQSLGLNINVCGLVKDEKHNTSKLLDGRTLEVINIDRKSYAFYLMMRIQEEVHRFAITYQRSIRNKTTKYSILDDIEGIGPKRKMKLLKKFKSISNLKSASIDEITEIGISEAIAEKILKKINKM